GSGAGGDLYSRRRMGVRVESGRGARDAAVSADGVGSGERGVSHGERFERSGGGGGLPLRATVDRAKREAVSHRSGSAGGDRAFGGRAPGADDRDADGDGGARQQLRGRGPGAARGG